MDVEQDCATEVDGILTSGEHEEHGEKYRRKGDTDESRARVA